MNIHHHYDQLTEKERSFVDEVFSDAYPKARAYGVNLTNCDDAERAVDAFARFVIQSRPVPVIKAPDPEPLPPLPRYSEPTKEQEDAAFWKHVGNIAP